MDTYTNNLAFLKSNNLAAELQDFLTDIEGLIAEATTMTEEELAEAKTKLNDRIDSIKHSFDDIGNSINHKIRRNVAMTNRYVHQQPWKAVGVSVLAGAVVGFLFSRRC
jgi:ElaB/YqjD/DUF883 family membrane-anchored ribosome-binding protein